MERDVKEFLESMMKEIQSVNRRLGNLEGKFENFEGKLGNLEGKFENFEGKLGNLEGKFESLDVKLESLEAKFENLETKVDETKQICEAVRHAQELSSAKIDSIEKSMRYVKAKLTEHDEKIYTLSESHLEI